MTKRPLVPPDGGWGWMVVFGVAVCNATTQSLLSVFGLLFNDTFAEMNVATTGAAVVGNSMVAITNFTGLVMGPVMRRFSYRQVAIAGGLFVSVGMLLTSFAHRMWHLLIFYSLLVGVGLGLMMPSTFVAVNAYFTRARGRAVGLSLAGTGLGQMLMPQAVRFLLDEYSFRGSVTILSAIALHSLPGAMLFHPLRWHAKPAPLPAPSHDDGGTPVCGLPPPGGKGSATKEKEVKVEMVDEACVGSSELKSRYNGYLSEDADLHEGRETMLPLVARGVDEDGEGEPARSRRVKSPERPLLPPRSPPAPRGTTRSRPPSPTSSPSPLATAAVDGDQLPVLTEIAADKEKSGGLNGSAPGVGKPPPRRLPRWVKALDLDLLSDLKMANLLSGLAAVYTSGVTFNMLLPFFLADAGLARSDVAFCMSMQAGFDIFSRLVLPPFTDKARVPARITFLIGALGLAASRSLLALQSSLAAMLAMTGLVGFVRGTTIVTLNLAISESCSADRLPGALGISMVLKGISSLAVGLFIGWLRDFTGSYTLCIHVLSLVIVVPMVIWIIEMLVQQRQKRLRR